MRERAEGRREFWAACHSFFFIKSTHPHLMSKEPAAGETGGDREKERRVPEREPKPKQREYHRSLSRASIRNDPQPWRWLTRW